MTMSMVAAAGHSPRFERLYGNTPAATGRTDASDRAARRDDGETRAERRTDDGPGPRNPLVRALMQALQGLMPAQGATASPAPAAATGVATSADTGEAGQATAPTAAAPAAGSDGDTLKDAAVAFAYELFNALRSGRDDERGDRDGHRHHHHHHHGHHHGHGHGRRDYGDLAQGLRKLAQSIDVPAATPTAPAPGVPTTSTPPVSTAPAPAIDTAAPQADLPVAATTPESAPISLPDITPTRGMSMTVDIRVTIQWSATTAPDTAANPAPAEESPLLAAFKRLMDKLAPDAASGAAATDAPSAAEKLKSFLNGIADALRGQGGGAAAERPATGSLLSVAA